MSPRKRSKLRAIDAGTRYGVAGGLKRLARAIERGEYGDVRDAVIGISTPANNGGKCVDTFHLGTGTIPDALYLWERAKAKMVG